MADQDGNQGTQAREKLIQWFLGLLDRHERGWSRPQLDFLDSLLQGQEGTKTLAELAVTSVRLRSSGLKPEEMGRLKTIHAAIEVFWENPSPETYENLRVAGRSLESDH